MDYFIANNHGAKISFIKCEGISEVLVNTKIISFTTTAATPFLYDTSLLGEKHTVLGVSLRDFAPEIIEEAYNVVDDYEHVCKERTSIHLTHIKRGKDDFVAGNIAEVIKGSIPPREAGKPTIYSPFGLGILDITLADYVYKQALDKGMGIKIENFLP